MGEGLAGERPAPGPAPHPGAPLTGRAHAGVLFSALEFGNMQKVNKPDVVCDDPEEVAEPTSSTSCSEHRAECERLLTAAAFEECLGLVPLAPYVQACVQDSCQCPRGASCACSTLAEFSRQCSHAGGRPGAWRNATLCRECPGAARGGRGATRARPGGRGRPTAGVLVCRSGATSADHRSSLGLGCEAFAKQGRSPDARASSSAARLCPFSQELPWEHGLPGERLALHGHLLSPGGQQPVRGASHGRLFLPQR